MPDSRLSPSETAPADLAALFERAAAPVADSLEAGRIPGAVFGVVDLASGRVTGAAGLAARVPVARPMHEATWFDLASVSKVLFTTPAILALHATGQIDVDRPLTDAIPDLRQYEPGCWERKVTFRQCLAHQTPFPAVEPFYTYHSDPQLLRHFIVQRAFKAGTPVYSDVNFILLGIALERLAGRGIREMDPGPGFAWLAPPNAAAATELCPWRGRVLSGEVHDENTSALQGAGHAGLFGTIGSVLDAAEALLRRDAAGDETVRLMREPQSATTVLGWQRAHAGWSGGDAADSTVIGHTGFTGTGVWIDFARGRAWALLTNRVHPSRHYDSGIHELRRAVGDLVSAG